MKIVLLSVILLLLLPFQGWAQSDSLGECVSRSRFARHMDKVTASRAYRMTYIGVPLIIGGLIVKGRDQGFRSLRNNYASSFNTHYDDYLQYGPAALMLGLKIGGVKGRSSWGRMLVSDVFSAGVMALTVNVLKSTADVTRPDGSNNKSFPSGHTATAFMMATMLHKEYGGRSPWYSVAGYTMATVTGVSRMLNNKHWLSDVLVGAGIGILSTEVGYLLADLIYKKRGINYFELNETYDRYRNPSFLGLTLGVDWIHGNYHPTEGACLTFASGVNLGVEGAWFMSPYIGFGGRIAITSVSAKLNGVALAERLESLSEGVGLYLSYPITARWRVGGKTLLGYEHYAGLDALDYSFGKVGGLSVSAGCSMTYRVSQTLDVRFSADYSLMPPLTAQSDQYLHKISFATAMNIAF
ncbi:MAG: phosphatase PAP2 family protein [Alistipes sp.]